jgi:hypothetical protein
MTLLPPYQMMSAIAKPASISVTAASGCGSPA